MPQLVVKVNQDGQKNCTRVQKLRKYFKFSSVNLSFDFRVNMIKTGCMGLVATCGTTTLWGKEDKKGIYLDLVGVRCHLIVTAEQILVDDHFCKLGTLSLKI